VQQQVALKVPLTAAVCGLEAMGRWTHVLLGVGLDVLIEVDLLGAKERGLGSEFGLTNLWFECHGVRKWHGENFGLCLSSCFGEKLPLLS